MLESAGIVFCCLCRIFTGHLYEWCGGDLLGVLFGSVNNSVWEQNKTTLLAYFLWGIIEILLLQHAMKRLTVAKTASLYCTGLLLTGGSIINGGWIVCIVSLIVSAGFSTVLFTSSLNLKSLFAPCLFLLLLFLAFYFCFTPFPPHLRLFEDPQTHFYGIIPPYIDKGAAILSN